MKRKIQTYEMNDGSLIYSKLNKVEFTNPIEYFFESHLNFVLRAELELKALEISRFFDDKGIPLKNEIEIIHNNISVLDDWQKEMFDSALQYCRNEFENKRKTPVPFQFTSLFKSKSKKEQTRLLKNQSISPDEILAFYCKAFEDFGYKYSEYKSEYLPKDMEDKQLPTLFFDEGSKIGKVGSTELSDEQLRHAIKFKKGAIARFLDKEDSFHCFFSTYRSLNGKESWKGGEPHLHYISDKFGFSREEVLSQLMSRDYKLGNLQHISIRDYNK